MNVFDVLREKLKEASKTMMPVIPTAEAIKIVDQVEKEYQDGWIPADEPPKDDSPVLLSFANFSVPLVGRYDKDENGGGAYYVGDEDEPLVKQDIFVNGWQPLPKQYQPQEGA